jgi:hypothetical protein
MGVSANVGLPWFYCNELSLALPCRPALRSEGARVRETRASRGENPKDHAFRRRTPAGFSGDDHTETFEISIE